MRLPCSILTAWLPPRQPRSVAIALLALSVLLVACASTAPPRFGPPPWQKGQQTAGPPPYRTTEFEVPPGRAHVLTVNGLKAGGVMEGYLEVRGPNGSELSFGVRAPNGDVVLDVPMVRERHEFRFEARLDGAYQLTFDNTAWPTGTKRVTLVWRGYVPAR